MRTWYIVEIEDDNTYPDKIKVTLYDPTEPGFYGKKLASTSVPSEKHIAIGAKTVFESVYGNPDEKPNLRQVGSTEGTLYVPYNGTEYSGDLMWRPVERDGHPSSRWDTEDDYQGA